MMPLDLAYKAGLAWHIPFRRIEGTEVWQDSIISVDTVR